MSEDFNILVYEDQLDVAESWLKCLNSNKTKIREFLSLEDKVEIYIEHVNRIENIEQKLRNKKFDLILSDTMELPDYGLNYKFLRSRKDITKYNDDYSKTPIILVGSNRRNDENRDAELFQDEVIREPTPTSDIEDAQRNSNKVYISHFIQDKYRRKVIINEKYGENKGNFTLKTLEKHSEEIKDLINIH